MVFSNLVQKKYFSFEPEYKITGIAKSFSNFLQPVVADACHYEILKNVEFVPHTYGKLTNMKCANRPVGDVYNGDIVRISESPETELTSAVLKIFESTFFINFISSVLGEELHFVRPATPYKFQKGDYLCLHDDMSDPYHTCEVVLNLTKDWRKSFGGFSIGGYVLRREPAYTPDEFPFYLRKIILDRSKPFYCSTPVFNKLSVLRLSDALCHGTSVIRTNQPRLVIAAIYSGKKARKTTTIWKKEVTL